MTFPKKRSPMRKPPNHVLVVDVGGSHVRFLLTGQENPRRQWREMGEPEYLSSAQVQELEAASRLAKEPFDVTYADGTVRFDVDLPPHAIAAVTLELTPGSPDRGAAT